MVCVNYAPYIGAINYQTHCLKTAFAQMQQNVEFVNGNMFYTFKIALKCTNFL